MSCPFCYNAHVWAKEPRVEDDYFDAGLNGMLGLRHNQLQNLFMIITTKPKSRQIIYNRSNSYES